MPKAHKAVLKRPAKTAAAKVDGPKEFKIVRRDNPKQKREAYIMMNGKYLITCRVTQSPKYLDIITTIKEELAAQTTEPEAARTRLNELLVKAAA